MTVPAPLTTSEAMSLLGATSAGRDVAIRRLLDPAAVAVAGGATTVRSDAPGTAASDAAVVVPQLDAATWTAACAAGVAVVVTTAAGSGDLPAPDAATPARWLVRDPRLALARLSRRLDPRPPVAAVGVHPTAVVDPDALLGERVAVGAHAVVAAGAVLGDDVAMGPGSCVGAGSRIGAGTILRERVVVADGVVIGERCVLQAGAVIGSDGFGFAAGPGGVERIHHLGGVVLGDEVEVGANACIDRATLGFTVVGERSKLDNLVQIAHNVRLGSDVLVAGQAGIAGSTTVGDRVVIGGAAGVSDHVRIGDGARIAGGAGVTKAVPAGEAWGGYPAQPVARWARERYLIGRLEAIWAYVKGHA
jgi:UDP-3-O-[3-hydroxymyristoyl] glucosamine N-acyltransferase